MSHRTYIHIHHLSDIFLRICWIQNRDNIQSCIQQVFIETIPMSWRVNSCEGIFYVIIKTKLIRFISALLMFVLEFTFLQCSLSSSWFPQCRGGGGMLLRSHLFDDTWGSSTSSQIHCSYMLTILSSWFSIQQLNLMCKISSFWQKYINVSCPALRTYVKYIHIH